MLLYETLYFALLLTAGGRAGCLFTLAVYVAAVDDERLDLNLHQYCIQCCHCFGNRRYVRRKRICRRYSQPRCLFTGRPIILVIQSATLRPFHAPPSGAVLCNACHSWTCCWGVNKAFPLDYHVGGHLAIQVQVGYNP